MQVGLPIIATDNGGQTDFVKDGKNGFLVSYGAVNQLSNKMGKVLFGKHRSSKENVKKILSRYDDKSIANLYLRAVS
jgi:glycosyltransferase involved in cell wall biosynthesis